MNTTGDSVTDTFLQLGAIGALALLLLWFAFRVYNREIKRCDELEAELRAVQKDVIDKYVPALTEASRIVADAFVELRRERERNGRGR